MKNMTNHETAFESEYTYNEAKKLGLMKLKISDSLESFLIIQKRVNLESYKPFVAEDGGKSKTLYAIGLKDKDGNRVGDINIIFLEGRYNIYERVLKPFEFISGPKEHLRHMPNDFSDITLALDDDYVVSARGNIVLIANTEKGVSATELNKTTMNMIFNEK